jgi:CBS domain-containing protein
MNPQVSATPVHELMTRRLLTVEPKQEIALASQMMLWGGVRHLPVLEGGRLVGIVSDRDLLRASAGATNALTVRDVMAKDVQTIAPEATVEDACGRMATARINCLPVVKNGHLVGILTSTDVLAERARLLHRGGGAKVPQAGGLMRTNVLSLHPHDTLLDAVEKVLLAEIRHLPVVDDDKRVVGMVSDRDLRAAVGDLRSALEGNRRAMLSEMRVEEVMMPEPITLRPDASVLEIADVFIDDRIGAVPLVDARGTLVGILSYVDVLASLFGRSPR